MAKLTSKIQKMIFNTIVTNMNQLQKIIRDTYDDLMSMDFQVGNYCWTRTYIGDYSVYVKFESGNDYVSCQIEFESLYFAVWYLDDEIDDLIYLIIDDIFATCIESGQYKSGIVTLFGFMMLKNI
jgi:hypothetical protein